MRMYINMPQLLPHCCVRVRQLWICLHSTQLKIDKLFNRTHVSKCQRIGKCQSSSANCVKCCRIRIRIQIRYTIRSHCVRASASLMEMDYALALSTPEQAKADKWPRNCCASSDKQAASWLPCHSNNQIDTSCNARITVPASWAEQYSHTLLLSLHLLFLLLTLLPPLLATLLHFQLPKAALIRCQQLPPSKTNIQKKRSLSWRLVLMFEFSLIISLLSHA